LAVIPVESRPATGSKSPNEMLEAASTSELITLDEPSGGHSARWRVCRLLGVGGFAKVYEVEDEMGRHAACKAILADTPERKARARCEIEALGAAQSHRNVVGLIGATQVGDTFFVVQEVRAGDILDEVLRKRGLASEEGGEARAQRIVSQLLHALVHLHRRNIVHGDVKPENVLCGTSSADEIQLADFGSSVLLEQRTSHTLVDSGLSMGTALYAPPEVIRAESVSLASDMWSLGVLTYVLLSGCFPFSSANDTLNHRASFAAEPWRSQLSPSAREFVTTLLRHDPKRRRTAEEALQHPWLLPNVRCVTPVAQPVERCAPPTPSKRYRTAGLGDGTDENHPAGKRAKQLPLETAQCAHLGCIPELSLSEVELYAVP
jgi:serine/threonine protein kinase